jgi:uncharacterized protein
VIYFDTSALLKLAHEEAETGALVEWLNSRTGEFHVSSVIIEVEAARALRRNDPAALAALPGLLAKIGRIELDQTVRATASAYERPGLRSLDAIHLATAQLMNANSGIPLTAFVSYDRRLSETARAIGFTSVSPGQA